MVASPGSTPTPRHVAEQESVLREFQAELIGDKISGGRQALSSHGLGAFPCLCSVVQDSEMPGRAARERVQGPLPGFVQCVNGRTLPVNSCQYCRYDCTQ